MPINVLIVLDGDYRFSVHESEPYTGTQDFTYSTLVTTLESAGMSVTKGHRDTDVTADINDFDFSEQDLLAYDVIWLFGHHGRNQFPGSEVSSGNHLLTPEEHAAIDAFMEAGGGIFATGDHDSIGADTGGHIKRVRAMRTWFGAGDSQGDTLPAGFPRNHDVVGLEQADTVQGNPQGDYSGEDQPFRFFENQSDSVPQPITPSGSPAHPVLRRDGNDITVFPDHMHEGNTLGEDELAPFIDGGTLTDFPSLDGHLELPRVVATGQSFAQHSKFATGGDFLTPVLPSPKTVNTLSTYDGRTVGMGRIVTGATFHHYIDINLTGDSDIDTEDEFDLTGPDAAKGQGFGYPGAEETFSDIKAAYINITRWLARPRPRIELILERSTFSQDESIADGQFNGAFLVTVDGLKPDQFPGGGITTLSPSQTQLNNWAPELTPEDSTGISIVPTDIDSDDPALPARLQRFTFTYRVMVDADAAFEFGGEIRTLRLDAELDASGVSAPLADSAWFQLVKAANPFMLDLANDNEKHWLSSDIRVFTVVAGESKLGHMLPDAATPDQARSYLQSVLADLSPAQFENLPAAQAESQLSPFATTTVSNKNVYNFAIARVRLNGETVTADDVRVFFRIFTTQTTAALTFRRTGGDTPIDGTPTAGYKQTAGANPIALPGETAGGDEWLSFPMFATERAASPDGQSDGDNVKSIAPVEDSEVTTFFGALVDNNLDSPPYLPPSPGGGMAVSPASLLMDAHQCLVAQIEFSGTPIPDSARPSTSDKLSQRNIAMSAIANPGIDASRMALHTFEIDATPSPITDDYWPDELLLEWHGSVPDGTFTAVYIPTWQAAQVIELADRFYPRHELYELDEHTVAVPGGGIRYLPVPRHLKRQTGVLHVHFPLGVHKGERYDVSVRQVTYRDRAVERPKFEGRQISRAEALKLLASVQDSGEFREQLPRGAFHIGNDQVVVTDTKVFDMDGDSPVLIKVPGKKALERFARQSGRWRETLGAFQLGIPVSDKQTLAPELLRLLALLRWRADFLKPSSRWYTTFQRYIALLTDKVRALGADPFSVPPSANPRPPGHGKPGDDGGGPTDGGESDGPFLEPGDDAWLDDTKGLSSPDDAGAKAFSGKVSGLLYDHFGDFEGFTLENYAGNHSRFFSREPAIMDLAMMAWRERHIVTVITVAAESRRVRRLLLRGYPGGNGGS
ncbi:hypothetical protein [Microbulbifer halophilus]|uniref:Uncharacterized protein n=1 Tax=Microbulbifer halophilus TaxID=453963 RepID=A0ABW5EG47_9GAMM|nr:hypothetical protein [Microbulbifer halophilus]MCW8126032.1 hypothetical protein [Microbulbifer halophilus]